MITFVPLKSEHFPLLSKWLQTSHVSEWWSDGKVWDEKAVVEKYHPYVAGYKINERGEKKPMSAFIVKRDDALVGYIQFYNVFDFERAGFRDVQAYLPASCAALDFYIGDPTVLGKGLGATILKQFLKENVFKEFSACYVDPDRDNVRALATYRKSGFFELLPEESLVPGLSFIPLLTERA